MVPRWSALIQEFFWCAPPFTQGPCTCVCPCAMKGLDWECRHTRTHTQAWAGPAKGPCTCVSFCNEMLGLGKAGPHSQAWAGPTQGLCTCVSLCSREITFLSAGLVYANHVHTYSQKCLFCWGAVSIIQTDVRSVPTKQAFQHTTSLNNYRRGGPRLHSGTPCAGC